MAETLYFTGAVSQAPLSFTGDGQASQVIATGKVAAQGPAGTISVGTVTTGAAGSSASISNSGTSSAAILNFTIPKGDTGPGSTWGAIAGTLSAQTDLQTALTAKADKVSITGATKTKVTYNAQGIVTAGADATTADIADSTDKRYVTDAQRTVIGNTSGTNTGDQDLSGYATSSALTTGLAGKQASLVSGTNIKTVNGTPLLGSGDLTISGGSGATATTTTQGKVLQHVYNMRDYGCALDGTTDDSSAINTQIGIIMTMAGGKGILYFDGVAALGTTITVPESKGLTFEANGWESGVKVKNGTNIYAFTFSPGTTGVWTYFRNMKIDGNCSNQTTGGGGIYAPGAIESYFDHIWFYNCYNEAAKLDHVSSGNFGHHNVFMACHFDGGNTSAGYGIGISFTENDENRVIACDFQYMGGASGSYQSDIVDFCGLQTIANTVHVSGKEAIRIQDASNTTIIGGTFDKIINDNIVLKGTGNKVTGGDWVEIGDTGTANTACAIRVDYYGQNNITGNTVRSHHTNGQTRSFIRETGNVASGVAGGNVISGNTFLVNGTLGTGNVEQTNSNIVTGNFPDSVNNGIAGLLSAGTNVTLTGAGTSASPYVVSATGGGSATPAGSNKQLQYNNSGAFGAMNGWWNGSQLAFGVENYDRTFNVTGDGFLVRSVDNTKAFRARFGGATDFEATGSLYISTWDGSGTGGGFTGGQYNHFILDGWGGPIKVGRDLSMETFKVTNLATPSSAQDAATKAYVDSQDSSLQSQITTNTTNISSNTTAINTKAAKGYAIAMAVALG